MNLFIDNNLPPIFVDVFDEYLRSQHSGCACHARRNTLGIVHDMTDIDWMSILANDRSDWVVLTNDHKIRRKPIELVAWQNSGLKGIIINRGFATLSKNMQIAKMFTHLPRTVETMQAANDGDFYEMNANGIIRKL